MPLSHVLSLSLSLIIAVLTNFTDAALSDGDEYYDGMDTGYHFVSARSVIMSFAYRDSPSVEYLALFVVITYVF